ncbi:MAG: hypothetical protein OXF02_06110 [Simkaniaceae bacterium]|nr:hypothetical protein [Simkaniaceae bacterium]
MPISTYPIDMVRELLTRGAGSDRYDHKGVVFLIVANRLGRKEMAGELIGYGVDPPHVGDTDGTALGRVFEKGRGQTGKWPAPA